MTVQLVQGEGIRTLGMDLRRMCFAFSPDYLSAIAKRRQGYSGVFAIDIAEAPCFVPAVLFRKTFLSVMTILAPPSDKNGCRLQPDHETEALEALIAHVRDSRLAHRLTQPTNWCVFQRAPGGAVSAPFGSYVLHLAVGIDAIWKNLHQKHRNAIRNAEKNCVRIEEGRNELSRCFSLYRSTMLRNGMACEPQEFLDSMLKSKDFDVFCGVAYVGDRPVSAIFAPYNAHGAYYLFGGISKNIGVNGANNLLHFEAIRAFAAQGSGFYNFVGARLGVVDSCRLGGIQRFKARFGAELDRGLLWKQDLSAFHCGAYDALLGFRNCATGNRKSMDIIDQERRRLNAHG